MKDTELRPDIAKKILKNNLQREHKNLSKFACQSSSVIRFRGDKIPDRFNIRPAFFHDTDKIIHSLSYTRYIDKTQVFYLFDNDHITHRVLHVQLVSKIARVIGRSLLLNEDLIEAISLGHDLGHVPYGHDGERKLNELLQNSTGEFFTHNAQSVRALEYLEDGGNGLNISLQVLDGILCHNGELMKKRYDPDFTKTGDKFLDEYQKCWEVKDYGKEIISMTLEGCVMRISDVIAYIGRDLEDAITLKLIDREDIPRSVADTIGNNNGDIINNLALDIINNSFGENYIQLSEDKFKALEEFYNFSIDAIYQNPKKSYQDEKIKNMIDILFKKYMKDLNYCDSNSHIVKHFLSNMNAEYRDETSKPRIVCDFIAGMTDDFFNSEFKDAVVPHSFGMTV